MHTSPCAVCGAVFEHRQARTQYCSKDCGSKASYERRRDAGTFVKPIHQRTCIVCGKIWATTAPHAKYCSQTCVYAIRYPAAARVHQPAMGERRRAARHKLRWSAHGRRGTCTWTSGQCRMCGAWFTSEHRNITCGDDCYREYHGDSYARQRSISRMSRRARERNAFVEKVDPQRVFESDGYRCHLCKRMTLRGKTVPHPRAPTVDHIIPLAAKGKHEPRNCRTACFLCNSTKSHLGGGQLLLLAV